MRDAFEQLSRAEIAVAKTILEALVNLGAEQTFSLPAFKDMGGQEISYA